MSKKLPVHFWPFAGSQLITNLGDGMIIVVVTILTSRISNSAITLGTVLAMLGLPWLLFSIFAGSIIDSQGAYKVAKYANLSRVIIVMLLAMLVLFEILTIPILAIIAFILGIFEVLSDNSHTVLLPELIESDKLEKANSITSTAELVSNKFIGVNLGALLLGVSVIFTFMINVSLFLLAPVLLIMAKYYSKNYKYVTGFNEIQLNKEAFSLKKYFYNLGFGIRYILSHQKLLLIMVIGFVWNFAYGAQQSFFILYIKNTLGSTEQIYAILISIAGLGGLCGGLTINYILNKLGRYNVLLIGILLNAGQYILKYSFVAIPIFVFAVFFQGYSDIFFSTIAVSFRQRIVPKEYLGRVTTTLRFVVIGAISLGTLSGGFIAEKVSHSYLGIVLGVIVGIVGIISLRLIGDMGDEQLSDKIIQVQQ